MRVRLLTLRMALFQFGFGLVSVLVLGLLNRVMFAEIGLPATLIGLLLAMPSIVSPLRLWLGYVSDSRPILGHRRLPYILAGTVLTAVGVLAGTLGALWIVESTLVGLLVALIAFLIHGMGKNAMGTVFQALIADVFDEQQRPEATAVLKAAFIFGIIGGSVILGRLIEPYSPERLLVVVAGTGGLAVVLSLLGCVAVEPTGEAVQAVSQRARELPFGPALKATLANPQVRLFFFFIGAALLSTLSQDVFLEPYGATVFGMSVGQTVRLNMYWGTGMLLALMLAGIWLVNRFGRKPVTAVGLAGVAAAFAGIILVGVAGQRAFFIGLVFLLGFASGMVASGTLTMMVDFTTPERAGLLMGTWTIAHQMAQVVGTLMGGILVDTVLAASGSHVAAFSTVFGLEIAMAAFALVLLPHVRLSSLTGGEAPASARISRLPASDR